MAGLLPTPVRPVRAFRWLIAALIVLVLLFATMAMTAREREVATTFENIVATVLHPFQSATGWVARQARDGIQAVRDVRALRGENARLQGEVDEMRHLKVLNQIMAAENRKLRAELGLREQTPYRLLAAEVMIRDTNNWFKEVVINRGTRDGVREGMAVINSRGLVGVVMRATLTTSTVRLLLDQDFGISSLTVDETGNGEAGVVLGRGGTVEVEVGQNPVARVNPGDAVVTSGLGEKVPRDLFIGTVESVASRENNLLKVGVIRPGVDFSRLDFVQVVLTAPPRPEEAAPFGDPAGPGIPSQPADGTGP